jgi:hypothetical protein
MFLLGTLLSANAQISKNGLVGWWPFAGNANDNSGNGNDGTVNGAQLTSDRFGNPNSAYQFNGSTSYIQMSKGSIIGNSPRTISFWAMTSQTGEMVPFDYGDANGNGGTFQIQFNNGCLGIGLDASNGVITRGSSSLFDNSWHHYALVLDTSVGDEINQVLIYADGILLTTISCGALNQNANVNTVDVNPICIGKAAANSIRFFDGNLDDIGIWNRALTNREVESLYKGCNLISSGPINQSSNINNQAQFNTILSDTTVFYQWQSNAANVGWSNLSNNTTYTGVTSKKLIVNNIKLKNHEQLFRVIATKNTCKDTSVVAMLTVNDTCITSTTDTIYIKVNTSSLSNPVYNTVKVYPNPSSTQVIIDNGNFSTMGSYTAKIINSIGQEVFQSVINQQQFVIDAKTMGGAGIYTLYITDSNNKVVGVKKIVLQ